MELNPSPLKYVNFCNLKEFNKLFEYSFQELIILSYHIYYIYHLFDSIGKVTLLNMLYIRKLNIRKDNEIM